MNMGKMLDNGELMFFDTDCDIDYALNTCIDDIMENEWVDGDEPFDGDTTEAIANRFLELLNERNGNL